MTLYVMIIPQMKTFITPVNLTRKNSKKASDKEDWDCLKFDLERAALNLEDASNTENLQCLVITHRILHDLDANVFNKNNHSSNSATYDVSITYLAICGKVYEPPEEMPPPGA